MPLLPEAGGELAVLHAQDTGYGLNPGSPPPALVCRIAKSRTPYLRIHARESDEFISHANSFEHYQWIKGSASDVKNHVKNVIRSTI
ncbi:MAG: hypothetical protein JRJ50_01550 [Deltaproteobacteria bacterium]|nr:hypothetical protein [Deltaproteobacteria bacterium]